MSRIEALLRFLWDFVVGDDWRIAVGVVVALGLTATFVLSPWGLAKSQTPLAGPVTLPAIRSAP